ncbi:hypothetical protein JCM10908_004242 [Rhodotorula pacifica]|uniref:uncharacterized protein n=1 Tax=Rhodotorula pacifica TaxID=1495444 RepID=UPI003181A349
MAPTTRKRHEFTLEIPTVPAARPKRKAAVKNLPSTSKPTTRPKRAAATAPRKTAYRVKKGQTPAQDEDRESGEDEMAISSHRDETTTEVEDDDEQDDDDNNTTVQAKDNARKRKATSKGSETEKVTDSEAGDGDSDSDTSEDSDAAVQNLLTPRKRQKRQAQRLSDEEEHEPEGGRAGTVIPDTDYEGPALTISQSLPSSSRKVSQTYASRKRVDKGKGKAVEPSPEATADNQEDDEEIEEAEGADGEESEEVVAGQRQPVASTSRKPSQKLSGKAPHRSPPKKRVAAPPPGSPARPTSSKKQRPSPRKRVVQQPDPSPAAQQQNGAAPSSESEQEQQSPPRRTSPRRTFQPAPSEDGDGDHDDDDDDDDDCWDENKTVFPPELFYHWKRARGGQADRIWVHDQWVSQGKRDQVVAFIEDNGGRVVKAMKKAQIAILPPWYSSGYEKLYEEARGLGVWPLVYAWVQDCARKSAQQGRAVRLSRSDYGAPMPRRKADGRSKRYLKLSYDETERFAKLYARWMREEISRGEMLERMQNEFFDGSPRTTIDGFAASLKEHEREIRSRAKKVIREAERYPDDEGEEGHTTDAAGRTEDEAYEGMRTRRRKTPRASSSSSKHGQRREIEPERGGRQEEAESGPNDLEALSTLSTTYRRPLNLIHSVYLACAFNLSATEAALQILREFDFGTMDLPSDSEECQRAMLTARDQIHAQVGLMWTPAEDRKLLERGSKFAKQVAREKDLELEEVLDRRSALEAIQGGGLESWYPDKEGFEQWRREVLDEEDQEEEEAEDAVAQQGSDGAEEEEEEEMSELEPL